MKSTSIFVSAILGAVLLHELPPEHKHDLVAAVPAQPHSEHQDHRPVIQITAPMFGLST